LNRAPLVEEEDRNKEKATKGRKREKKKTSEGRVNPNGGKTPNRGH